MAISRLQQSRQMRRGGGIMGSNAGSMLVAPTKDGSRPGYYGPDAGFGTEKEREVERSWSGGEGISDADARRALASNQNTLATNLSAAKAQKEQQAKAAAAKQAAIQKDLNARRGVTPAAYSYGKKTNPYDFSKRPRGPRGFIDAGIMVAKDLYTKYQNNRIRNLMMKGDIEIDPVTGKYVQSVDEFGNIINPGPGGMEKKIQTIPIDEPDSGFFKSRVKDEFKDGDGPPILLPINYNTGDEDVEDVEEEKTFDYHLGLGGQKTGRDVTLGYLASGGRARRAEGGIMGLRARKAFGGIMDRVTGRRAYGLGSIFKSVKKAVSKVLKSDVGKMALLAAGAYYTGGALGGTGGFNNFATLGSKAMKGAKFLGKKALFTDGALDFGKAAILGASALPFFMKQPKDPDIGMADRGGSLIDPITGQPAKPAEMRASLNNALENADGDPVRIQQINDAYAFLGPDERLGTYLPYRTYGVKDGGRIGKAEGGLMDLGGMEKDYRAEGGFVPIGEYEKKDDVPARLSVNEFVFTADAVRGAGGGDIDKGAEIMENMMENLEKGGTVSEESQGNAGAQQMFDTSERLGEVI